MTGLSISRNRSKILSTWDSSRRFRKTKMTNLAMRISVSKIKSLSLKAVKKPLKVVMMISLVMKDPLPLSRRKKKANSIPNKSQPA
jgi:hypothetical protein